jgi:3-hydroxyisobutyrate dehydrogenase-like beta-hydroxyacid dehydrogenase
MSKLSFLGLGQMGAPMATRLLEAGHELTVWNRSKEKAAPLRERGAEVASTPAQATTGAKAVFTMLSTPRVVEEVVTGPEGVVAGIGSDGIVVEMSTIGPAAFHKLRDEVGETALVDAPVLGSVPQAESGELQIFVGADESTFQTLQPWLDPMGTPLLMGPPGAGAAMKLVANSTLGALITTLGEAMRLADALGLERDAVLERLGNSPIGTTVGRKKEHIASGHYPPNFKLELSVKDMRLVQEAAQAAGIDLRVNRAAGSWIEEAFKAGLGDLDYSAVVAHILGTTAKP